MAAISLKESSQLSWLKAKLAYKRNSIADLLRSLSGLGSMRALKPVLFGKFVQILDEVATAKTAENGLLARIETIERKHKHLRKNKGLKLAKSRRYAPAIGTTALVDDMTDKAPKPSRRLIGWIMVWYILTRGKRNQKKQDLTVD